MTSEQRKHHSRALGFNSEKYLLTHRLQKNREETATTDYTNKMKTEIMGHSLFWVCSRVPCDGPSGASASPPVTWR